LFALDPRTVRLTAAAAVVVLSAVKPNPDGYTHTIYPDGEDVKEVKDWMSGATHTTYSDGKWVSGETF
jgi:hypothetical protein